MPLNNGKNTIKRRLIQTLHFAYNTYWKVMDKLVVTNVTSNLIQHFLVRSSRVNSSTSKPRKLMHLVYMFIAVK